MPTVETLKDLSHLGYLKYLLEQEFDRPTVEEMIKHVQHYSADDIERVSNAIERFGAKELFAALKD